MDNKIVGPYYPFNIAPIPKVAFHVFGTKLVHLRVAIKNRHFIASFHKRVCIV